MNRRIIFRIKCTCKPNNQVQSQKIEKRREMITQIDKIDEEIYPEIKSSYTDSVCHSSSAKTEIEVMSIDLSLTEKIDEWSKTAAILSQEKLYKSSIIIPFDITNENHSKQRTKPLYRGPQTECPRELRIEPTPKGIARPKELESHFQKKLRSSSASSVYASNKNNETVLKRTSWNSRSIRDINVATQSEYLTQDLKLERDETLDSSNQ